MRKLHNQKSSFWAGESFFEDDIDVLTGEKRNSNDVVALAAYRNSIANFVRIVTQQNIPVKFQSAGDSYTDGKSVVISAKLSDKEFDYAVGLALHEGSHVVKSNFDLVRDISIRYENRYGMGTYSGKEGAIVKDLLNIVEDRRIDKWVTTTAPGYKGYYHALYAKYFNTPIINKGLASSEYRDETWESYFFRVVNITNPNRDLDALKGLKDIWSVLDLRNIDRLKSTEDALDVAFDIYDIIKGRIEEAKAEEEESGEGQAGEGEEGNEAPQAGNNDDAGESDGEGEAGGDDDGETAEGSEAEAGNEGGANAGSSNEAESGSDQPELSDRQKKMLENAIKRQKEFQDGETRKKKVSKKDAKAIEAAQEADAEIVDIETKGKWGRNSKHRVMVLPRVTNEMLATNPLGIGMIMSGNYRNWRIEENEAAIAKGFVMGQRLGKKLKARNEDHSLKYNRLRSGSIDKRRISNLGYGTETVFQKIETMIYDDAAIHISIDASSSMRGEKWSQSITMAAAIAKAASMIEGLDVVISVRAEEWGGYGKGNTDRPILMVVYDLTKDNIARCRKVMSRIVPSGCTPEGICFEAIQKHLVAMKKGKEGYFLNLSDGMPGANDYGGSHALNHTRDQVNTMRKNGLHVLSYFVSDNDYDRESLSGQFKTMYGADARFVDVSSVADIANTMNAKFLVPKG
jgi:hypothetical protein